VRVRFLLERRPFWVEGWFAGAVFLVELELELHNLGRLVNYEFREMLVNTRASSLAFNSLRVIVLYLPLILVLRQ